MLIVNTESINITDDIITDQVSFRDRKSSDTAHHITTIIMVAA